MSHTVSARQTGHDEFTAVHASIKIGNSIIILNREAPEQGIFSPASLGGNGGQIHLYVDDVDTSWERAVEAGAGIQVALHDAFWGDRTGVLVDGNGHFWSMASKIENLSQEEIARRGREVAGSNVDDTGTDLPMVDPIPAEVMLADENVAV